MRSKGPSKTQSKTPPKPPEHETDEYIPSYSLTPEGNEMMKEIKAGRRGKMTEEEKILHDYKTRGQMLRRESERHARRAIKKEEGLDAKDEIEREYASRTLAKRRFLAYVKKFERGYLAGWVHKDIARRLEKFLLDVANGLSPRLMLCVPPRHGKSLLASNHFPSWALGHYPHFEIIAASYGISLPLGFSRKVRSRLRDDPVYQAMFPNTRLNPEAQNAEGWETTEGGGYIPAGIGGAITGKGAHILIIDDPVKDAQDADSQTVRETAWDWWGATAKTRLAPGGGVLVIQTRWHDDDLAGRMLLQQHEFEKEAADMEAHAQEVIDAYPAHAKKEDHPDLAAAYDELVQAKELREEMDRWELVNYPGIAEQDEYLSLEDHTVYDHPVPNSVCLRKKGDALHPERFSRARLMNMKRTMQPRHWSALYQQNPVPDEGVYFTKDLYRYRGSVSGGARSGEVRMMAVDLAITEKQVNDRTSLAIGALGWDKTVTVYEVVYGRWGTYGIVDTICNALVRWDVEILGIENGQLKHAILPILLTELSERDINVAFDDDLTPVTDKAARARPLQGLMQQGRWYYVSNDTWFPVVQQEMLRFPGGVRDDNVDSQAWLARMSLKVSPPTRPTSTVEGTEWRTKLGRMVAEQRAGDGGHMGA